MGEKVATQGGGFCFGVGATLYDHSAAYSAAWGDALKSVGRCVSIQSSTAAVEATKECDRFPGFVEVAILEPNKAQTRLVHSCRLALTQDEFVRFLITGEHG